MAFRRLEGAVRLRGQRAMALLHREYAAPILLSYHFSKSGVTYRKYAANGDVAVVNFQASISSTKEIRQFYVNVGVAPEPWLDWIQHRPEQEAIRPPNIEHMLVRTRITPTGWMQWSVGDEESVRTCGAALTELLPPALDNIISLMDRATFLRRLHGEGTPIRGVSHLAAEIALLVDDGLTDDLLKMLAEMNRRHTMTPDLPPGAESPYATWAFQRAQARPLTEAP